MVICSPWPSYLFWPSMNIYTKLLTRSARVVLLIAHVLGQFRGHRPLQQPLRQLLQQPVLAYQIFRLFVVLQQIVYQLIVYGHLFSLAKLPLLALNEHLHKTSYTLRPGRASHSPRARSVPRPSPAPAAASSAPSTARSRLSDLPAFCSPSADRLSAHCLWSSVLLGQATSFGPQ